jgi:apolipoprotein N-acyltransferase
VASAPAAPPTRSAARIVAGGLLLPAAAGAACVFAFAPFYAWPVEIAALAVLFGVWAASGSPRQAALSGFAFGLGYFLAGISWIFVSLHEFGGMPSILAAIATFFLCAYLALFPACAGWLTVRWAGGTPGRRLAMAAAAYVALEWLRGTLFTGFPWLDTGTSQAPASPLAGFAPWVGAYGVSLAAAGAAALLAAFVLSRAGSRVRFHLILGFAALFLAGGLARLPEWSHPAAAPVRVALLQGNVAQEMKWREEVRTRTLLDYRRMIFDAKAQVVVVPETALPAFLDQLPDDYLESLRENARAGGKDILLGTVERTQRGGAMEYFNSLVRITGQGRESYRKRHLVPFGEFMPPGFAWALAILHIPMSDFSRGKGSQPAIAAGGARFGVAICYEDMFGEEVIDALPAAQALVNVSNDAWFGHSLAAAQHLQGSQMRALETSRWMVRATNTGVTAAIDEHGRVVARLPEYTVGTLYADVVPRDGTTPYAYCGNLLALLLVALLAAAARFIPRRPPRAPAAGAAPRKAP